MYLTVGIRVTFTYFGERDRNTHVYHGTMHGTYVFAVHASIAVFLLVLMSEVHFGNCLPCGGGIYFDEIRKSTSFNTDAVRRQVSVHGSDAPHHGFQSRYTRQSDDHGSGQKSSDHTVCNVFLDSDASFAALWPNVSTAKLNMLSLMASVNEIFLLERNQDYIPVQFHVAGVNVNRNVNFDGTAVRTMSFWLLAFAGVYTPDANLGGMDGLVF